MKTMILYCKIPPNWLSNCTIVEPKLDVDPITLKSKQLLLLFCGGFWDHN